MSDPAATATSRLVVIDDEAIVGKRLKQVFNKVGFTVDIFTDPLTALEAMEKSPFDIVITDFKMEGLDGLEILKRARAINPDCRVIIITGYASLETAEEAQKHGVFSFLAKPFRLDELKQVIFEALKSIEKNRRTSA